MNNKLFKDSMKHKKRGIISTSPVWGPEKPCMGDRDKIHAYTRKLSCSLAILEISQVSDCKTSITLRYIPISNADRCPLTSSRPPLHEAKLWHN